MALSTTLTIQLLDKVSGPAKTMKTNLAGVAGVSGKMSLLKTSAGQVVDRLDGLKASALLVGTRMGKVANEAAALSGKLLLAGGAAAWFFKSQFVDTAAQFEKFTTVLETVEGSSEAARKSMEWVSNFAATTPNELEEVTDAFVKLRSYGIDPMNGTLRVLGDASSAMGKPLMQSVEALADAMTGQNERLKEFGIRAETKGSTTRFTYSDREGKTQHRDVLNNKDPEQLRAALLSIWDEKYAGAMEKQSKTWTGMMSNLSDQWTRFKMLVMNAGVFDFLKGKLKGLLDVLDRMAASGELKQWAERFGANLKDGLAKAWDAAKGLWEVMKGLGTAISVVADAVGGFRNLGIALAAVFAGNLLVSIAGLVTSLVSLGSAVAGVISTIAAASAGLAAGGVATGSVVAGAAATTLTVAAPVALAGAAGYGAGTLVNEGINKIDETYGTKIGEKIGEAVARVLAVFGNQEAKLAIEVTDKRVKVRKTTQGFNDDVRNGRMGMP